MGGVRSNRDKENLYTLEKIVREMECELSSVTNELEHYRRQITYLLLFLREIESHPSLQKEWKRFRVLYKTITGMEPPLDFTPS